MMQEQDEEESKHTFILVMQNLIKCIHENAGNQQAIYEGLNREDIQNLFDSLHDSLKQLRLTVCKFICLLLYNSPKIIELLLVGDKCDNVVHQHQKFIITGLKNYRFWNNPDHARKLISKVATVNYKKGVVFWYVHVNNLNVGYVTVQAMRDMPLPQIDPCQNIIGIFVKGDDELQKMDKSKRIQRYNSMSSQYSFASQSSSLHAPKRLQLEKYAMRRTPKVGQFSKNTASNAFCSQRVSRGRE